MPVYPVMASDTAIISYYIRYDIKSSNNRITDENVLMVPAKNEFRAEKFSQISLPCVISMTHGESKNKTLQRAKQAALKKILKEKGLQSVKAKNRVTIISYEGVLISPIQIVTIPGNDTTRFAYTAQFEFSPIAFPDKWQDLKTKSMIKEKIYDFFSLFK